MRIDSHHHFWNYSAENYGWISEKMAVLRRDFAPADLLKETQQTKIDAVVSVQARQSLEETQWLVSIAEEHELVAGVVGWLPLADQDIQQHVERYSHSPWLKGVRHVVQDEPDDAFILGEEFNRGVAHLKDYGLVYDVLIFAKHLQNSIQFVDQHPEQPFVLDHIAKPTIEGGEIDRQWESGIRELAKRDNVTCKFSGVATEVREDSWDLATVKPYWDVVLESFGAQRLMFGSDWPVCLLKTDYVRWVRTAEALVQELSQTEQTQFWSETAKQAYRLFR